MSFSSLFNTLASAIQPKSFMSGGLLVIKDSIVKKVENYYNDRNEITSIVLAEGVIEVSEKAFAYCKELRSVTFPLSLRKIGDWAFAECYRLSEIHISSLWHWIEIGALVPLFPFFHRLYLNEELVTDLIIPNGITTLPSGAFAKCLSITSLNIPEGVTEISSYAFSGCKNLTSVTLPRSLRKIGRGAFDGCGENLSVHISDIAAWCKIEFEEPLFLWRATNLYLYLNGEIITNLVVPEGVTEISSGAFLGYKKLLSITLPKSLRKIEEDAFHGCEGLTSIVIPDGVIEIAKGAFSGCKKLSTIALPQSLRKINEKVFHGCKGLTSIVIPEGVIEIANGAFSDCERLSAITFPKSLRKIGKNCFYGWSYLFKINIPDIALWCQIEFEEALFYDRRRFGLYLNKYLVKNLVIPEGVTEIPSCTFRGCASLISIVIPEGVTEIFSKTFSGCERLSAITLPKSLRKIGEWAFGMDWADADYDDACKKLSEVHISDIATWCSIEFNSNPLEYAKSLYLNGELVTNLVIPEGVTEIASKAFLNCTSLTSITLPKSLREIGYGAFEGCESLQEIILPNGEIYSLVMKYQDSAKKKYKLILLQH